MTQVKIINSRLISRAHGHDMFAWDEVDTAGNVRSFEEYPHTCWVPSFDRMMGMTLVRETTSVVTA